MRNNISSDLFTHTKIDKLIFSLNNFGTDMFKKKLIDCITLK